MVHESLLICPHVEKCTTTKQNKKNKSMLTFISIYVRLLIFLKSTFLCKVLSIMSFTRVQIVISSRLD